MQSSRTGFRGGSSTVPCIGPKERTSGMAGQAAHLILITRLPQRGSHLAVRFASWDELTSASTSLRQCYHDLRQL